LSVWQCDLSENNLANVALALSTAPNVERVETLNIVLLRQDQLVAQNFVFEETEGNTLATDLRNLHLDIVQLDLLKLAKLADMIAFNVKNDQFVYSFTRAKLIKLLLEMVNSGKLVQTTLNEKMLKELKLT
jgi:hypothetical protein